MKDKITFAFITVCFKVFNVIRKGFEPLTPNLEGLCSIQLSYRTIAECMGLEPMTSSVTGMHSNQLN